MVLTNYATRFAVKCKILTLLTLNRIAQNESAEYGKQKVTFKIGSQTLLLSNFNKVQLRGPVQVQQRKLRKSFVRGFAKSEQTSLTLWVLSKVKVARKAPVSYDCIIDFYLHAKTVMYIS